MKQSPFGGGRGKEKDLDSLSDGVIRITAASGLSRPEPHRRLCFIERDTLGHACFTGAQALDREGLDWLVLMDGQTGREQCQAGVLCVQPPAPPLLLKDSQGLASEYHRERRFSLCNSPSA